MNNLENNPRLLNAAQLILRLVFGFLFMAHGWQKFSQFTIEGTTAAFTDMGVPAAGLVAPTMATLEFAGGLALVLGIATRIFGALLALGMLGAILMVHAPGGVFVENGGFELVAALGAGAAAIALMGPGRIALDHLIFGRKRRERAAAAA